MSYKRASAVVDRQFGGNVTIHLKAEEYEALEKIAKRKDVSKTSIVMGLVREYLEGER